MGYLIKASKGNIIPSGPRPLSGTEIDGSLRYNTGTNALEYWNGLAYVEIAKTGRSQETVDTFTGDGLTAVFGPMAFSVAVPKNIVVFINGIYQIPVTHYAVAGTNITFQATPPNGESITVIHQLGSTYVLDADVFDVPNL